MRASPTSQKTLIAQTFVGLSLLALVTGFIVWSPAHAVRAQALQDGPTAAETMDLLSWRDRNGRTLKDASNQYGLSLIMVVSTNCETCADAKDAVQALRERAVKAGMAYYVLMIPDGTDPQKSFSYAESLKIDAEAFVWSNAEAKPPALITSLAVPSHLLMTREGLVVNKWVGIPKNTDTP